MERLSPSTSRKWFKQTRDTYIPCDKEMLAARLNNPKPEGNYEESNSETSEAEREHRTDTKESSRKSVSQPTVVGEAPTQGEVSTGGESSKKKGLKSVVKKTVQKSESAMGSREDKKEGKRNCEVPNRNQIELI